MDFNEYARHDGISLARAIRDGKTDSTSVLAAALARAERVEPAINSIVTRMDDIAQARAHETPAGPFAGVPFLLKDLFQDYQGVRTTYGSRALARPDFRPAEHAEIVKRFLAAGVNVIGKSNTPELGAKGVTEPIANGATRNPWHTDHTPGGSSGGSAAAVAAGIVPLAGANDGGGSIRIPAACCGLFGLKPGRARVPAGPHFTDQAHGIAVDHVLTRSVRDSAAMLDITAGYEPGAIARLAAPEMTYRQAAERDPKRLRIGLQDHSPLGTPLHAEAQASLNTAARQLTDLGHHVERAAPDMDGRQVARDFLMTWYVRMGGALSELRAQTGCAWRDFELDTRAMAHVGRAFTAVEYAQMHERWRDYRRALALFHERYDLLLTPSLGAPPVAVGAMDTPKTLRMLLPLVLRLPTSRLLVASGIVDRLAEDNLAPVPFTQLANLTGVPAMSVPLHWTQAGLPLGSQFVAPPGGEALLFQLAGQLERAAPWFDRRPQIAGIDI